MILAVLCGACHAHRPQATKTIALSNKAHPPRWWESGKGGFEDHGKGEEEPKRLCCCMEEKCSDFVDYDPLNRDYKVFWLRDEIPLCCEMKKFCTTKYPHAYGSLGGEDCFRMAEEYYGTDTDTDETPWPSPSPFRDGRLVDVAVVFGTHVNNDVTKSGETTYDCCCRARSGETWIRDILKNKKGYTQEQLEGMLECELVGSEPAFNKRIEKSAKKARTPRCEAIKALEHSRDLDRIRENRQYWDPKWETYISNAPDAWASFTHFGLGCVVYKKQVPRRDARWMQSILSGKRKREYPSPWSAM